MGLGDRDSSVRGTPAKVGTYEGPSCALRCGEVLDHLPLTFLELASCLAPGGENEGKWSPRTAEHGPKLDPGVPLKAGLAGAALRASSPVTAGPSGRAGLRMGQVQRAQVRQLPRPRTLSAWALWGPVAPVPIV